MRSLWQRLFSLLATATLLLSSCPAWPNDLYDAEFCYSTERFLSKHYGTDYLLLKAQGYAESALDPRARSPVGAMGIMQIMPATWAEISRQIGLNASPYNPRASIIAGAFYQNRMLDAFTSPRPAEDRRRWAWAAYNCGLGCVLKAQRRASMTTDYWHVRPYLPQETIIYVSRIQIYHQRLLFP